MSPYEFDRRRNNERWHMPKGKLETKISEMSGGQMTISIGLIILTLVLGANWSWVDNFSFGEKSRITPGSLEYEEKSAEFFRLRKKLESGINDGSLSVRETILTIRKSNRLSGELGFGYTNGLDIQQIVKEKFVERWRPYNGIILDEISRVQNASIEYERIVRDVVNEQDARGVVAENYGDDWLGKAIWWLLKKTFKWYWIMTIPTFLIVLLDLKYTGKKLSEELMLRPAVFLRACCGGPIGFLLMDDSVGRAYRYDKLVTEYLLDKPGGYSLGESERQAILRQVEEPLLAFEEALAAFMATGQLIRQPITVCFLVWLIGLSFSSHSRTLETSTPTAVVCDQKTWAPIVPELATLKVAPAKKVLTNQNVVKLVLIIGKAERVEPVESASVAPQETAQPPQRCSWEREKERGPPSPLVREHHTSKTLCPPELATAMEGYGHERDSSVDSLCAGNNG